MATTEKEINTSTYTEVLDGSGFAYCDTEVEYKFTDDASAPTGDGMVMNPRSQMTGMTGQKLWAKSTGFPAIVMSNPEV